MHKLGDTVREYHGPGERSVIRRGPRTAPNPQVDSKPLPAPQAAKPLRYHPPLQTLQNPPSATQPEPGPPASERRSGSSSRLPATPELPERLACMRAPLRAQRHRQTERLRLPGGPRAPAGVEVRAAILVGRRLLDTRTRPGQNSGGDRPRASRDSHWRPGRRGSLPPRGGRAGPDAGGRRAKMARPRTRHQPSRV